jgi:hypothetical protein
MNTFKIAGHTVALTDIESGTGSRPTYRFKMVVDGTVHERYAAETCELAERIHFEVTSTLESLCVALRIG